MEIPAPPSDHIPLGGVVSLEGRSRTPNDPVLRGQRAGPLAAGVLIYAPLEAFPPQWLVGVDWLRCKWLNLNFASGRIPASTQARTSGAGSKVVRNRRKHGPALGARRHG